MLEVDAKTVTRWAKAGKLTTIRTPGGHRRYYEDEARALLACPTIQETAALLGVSKMTVCRLIHSGGLEAIRGRRPWLVTEESVQAYLRAAASPEVLEATARRDAKIIHAYTRDGLNLHDSGARAGVSGDTARRVLARRGIDRRPPGGTGRGVHAEGGDDARAAAD
jgi:excisionase family DNA binding protein